MARSHELVSYTSRCAVKKLLTQSA